MDDYQNNITMHAKEALHASLAQCYVTTNGNRYNFMQATNLEANFEIEKTQLGILGRTGKANRSTNWKGSGSATFYFNTSIFRDMMLDYKKTGKITYFDIAITNYDPNSSAGRQTVILKDCTIDGGILAKFDANGEFLEEDMDFTFEDFEIPEKFSLLEGMLN